MAGAVRPKSKLLPVVLALTCLCAGLIIAGRALFPQQFFLFNHPMRPFRVITVADNVSGLLFSHDGQYLAYGTWEMNTQKNRIDGRLNLIDARLLKPASSFTLSGGSYLIVEQADGKHLLDICDHATSIDVIDIHSGVLSRTPVPKLALGIVPAADGQTLAFITRQGQNNNRTASLLLSTRKRQVYTLVKTQGDISAIAFSPDSSTLAAVISDRRPFFLDDIPPARVILFSVNHRTVLNETTTDDQPEYLAYSRDGSTLYGYNSFTRKLHSWSSPLLKVNWVNELPKELEGVALDVSPDGRYIALYGYNRFAIVRAKDGTIAGEQLSRRDTRQPGGPQPCAFAQDSRTLATLGEHAIELWHVPDH